MVQAREQVSVQVPGKRCNSQWRNSEFIGQRIPDDCAAWRRRSLWRRLLLLHSLLEDEASTEAGEYDWNCAFFDQTESTTQTANRSVQPFLHGRKSLYFTMGAPFPQQFPFPWGGESGPPSNAWALPVCCRTGRRCSTSWWSQDCTRRGKTWPTPDRRHDLESSNQSPSATNKHPSWRVRCRTSQQHSHT